MANIANVKVKQGNVLSLSGSSVEVTGSTTVSGNLAVQGVITAQELRVDQITENVIVRTSGSTLFGDNTADTHTFTGSVNISGLVSSSVGFSGSGAGLTNLTASQLTNFTQDVRAQLSGSGSINYDASSGIISSTALTTAVLRVVSGSDQNLVISNETGPTVTASLNTNIAVSGNITSLTGTVSGAVGKFTALSASSAEISGNILIFGSASLSNTSAAYVRYKSSNDRMEIFPGLDVGGSSTISGNLNVTGSVTGSVFSGSGAALTNLRASELSGVVALANGGTGKSLSGDLTGKLLIGSGSELVTGSLVAGNSIGITPGSGSITIAVTASFGAKKRTTVTGSYTVLPVDQAIFVNPSATSVVTLPAPTLVDGREITVKRVDSPLTAFAVDVSCSVNIDDANVFGLNGPMQSITLIADSGSNKWFVV
jgi:hypothetical protein